MNSQFVRDSFWGRIVYRYSGHRYFGYKEELPDYVIPDKYLADSEKVEYITTEGLTTSSATTIVPVGEISKEGELTIIVDWDGEDDPENPYNWPLLQKVVFGFEIAFLTLSVYMGSAIYTPGIEFLMEDLGIDRVKATLPLTMFVIGYGIGPMVFSPLSENAIFGRTSIYIITLFFFFILQIPQTFGVGTHSIASLTILRFLSGIFASPALATGVASFGDVVTLPYLPVGIAFWSISAVCGPSMGPLVGSALVNATHGAWVWTFRFMMIISGFCFVILGFFLPESYSKTLLRRKAQRLRAVTGNQNIMSEGEIENKNMTVGELAVDILWRPFEIALFEPVVLLVDLYISLVYLILYLWFEAFPIVFLENYGFTLVELGATYVSVMVGVLFGAIFYIAIIYQIFTKKFFKGQGDDISPEIFMPLSILGSVLLTIGLFIFAWASNPHHHWMGPLVGAAIHCAGGFLIFQTLFNYLAMSFPRYMASVFAGNDLFRSVIAGCFPLFGTPMFKNLSIKNFPVAWGTTILGFISIAMIAIPVTFYALGEKLRARSKYLG